MLLCIFLNLQKENMENNVKSQLSEEKTKEKDLNPSVKKALKKIAEKEGYTDYKIYKRTISTDGGNYLGVLYEVNIDGDTAEGKKETSLFVKHVISGAENVKLLSVSEVYMNEKFIYTELARIFTRLQNESSIPAGDRFNMAQSYDGNTNDAIILENISIKGFKTYDRMGLMSLQYAKLCVQQLARFHGLSFVIEKRMPEYFEKRIKTMKQLMYNDETLPELITKMYRKISSKLTPDSKNRIDKCWKKLIDGYLKYMHGVMANAKCLCHGDYKMNNVMYKEIEGEVTKVIPVDFQLVYYGSPVIDFIYFIFMSTDREFRKNHTNDLKDIYHDSLKKFLEYFDMPIDEIYPRKMFETDFENCLDYGLVTGIFILPFMFTSDDETPDIGSTDLTDLSFTIDNSFYDRLQGIVDDFIEWGYL